MAKIIHFPRPARRKPDRPRGAGADSEPSTPGPEWLHILFVLAWPLLRWVFALDVLVQLVRMLGHWGGASSWPELRFALHMAAYIAATYAVAQYKKPKL